MSDLVTLPRKRYEQLLRCERLVDLGEEAQLSDACAAGVKESLAEYRRGEFVRVKDRKHRKALFDDL